MSAIVKHIDRIPFWAWPALGAGAGALTGGLLMAGQLLVGVLS